MLILSIEFLRLVAITLVIYYLLPARLQNIVLLAASYYFYYTWVRFPVYFLIGYTVFNFLMGLALQRSTRVKRALLWLGVLTNIGVLLWFLFATLLIFPHIDSSILEQRVLTKFVLLPVGLSYYALNCTSYLIDIYLRVSKPSTNFVDFALYLAWFPKLITGPLELGRKFLPALAQKRTLDNAALARNLTLILVGLFRASILAGALALLIPSQALYDLHAHGNPVLLWAVLTYAFYLYNQFAGYSDIARGVSGLFGIPLTRNFAQPFFAKDFSDFWKRWHISLSQWFQAYIYMPISRAFLRRNPSRNNIPNLIVPPLVTMLVSGLWHGAKPQLLIWGVLMGTFIMLENLRNLSRPANFAASLPAWRRFAERAFLIGCLFAATVPFVMDLANARFFLRQALLGWNGVPLDPRPIAVLILSLVVDWVQYRADDELVFLKWPAWAQTILVTLIPLAVIVISQLQSAPAVFVYP